MLVKSFLGFLLWVFLSMRRRELAIARCDNSNHSELSRTSNDTCELTPKDYLNKKQSQQLHHGLAKKLEEVDDRGDTPEWATASASSCENLQRCFGIGAV